MMRMRVFLHTAFVLALAAGTPALAQDVAPAIVSPPPSATSELPFSNDGANQPVLQTLSPDGVAIDPAAVQALHGEAAATEAHAKKAGLPQFDVTTFPKQLFWLTLTFAFLYIVYSRKTLPAISSVLENRRERVASDLRAAEDLKKEVERVRAEYEAAIGQAQGDAQRLIASIQTDMKKTLEAREAQFKQKADDAVAALEARIENSRARVMSDLSNVAAEITVDIAARIAGVKASAADARDVIDGIAPKAKAA